MRRGWHSAVRANRGAQALGCTLLAALALGACSAPGVGQGAGAGTAATADQGRTTTSTKAPRTVRQPDAAKAQAALGRIVISAKEAGYPKAPTSSVGLARPTWTSAIAATPARACASPASSRSSTTTTPPPRPARTTRWSATRS